MAAAENETIAVIIESLESEREVENRESEEDALRDLGNQLSEREKRDLLEKEEDLIIAAQRFKSTYDTLETLTDERDIDEHLDQSIDFIESEKEALESRYLDRIKESWLTDTAILDINNSEDTVSGLAHIGREADKGGLLHEYTDQLLDAAEDLPTASPDSRIDVDQIYNGIEELSSQLGFSERETDVYTELTEIKAEISNIESSETDLTPVIDEVEDMRSEIMENIGDYNQDISELETTLDQLKRQIIAYDNSTDIENLSNIVDTYHSSVSHQLNEIEDRVEDNTEITRETRENTEQILQELRSGRDEESEGVFQKITGLTDYLPTGFFSRDSSSGNGQRDNLLEDENKRDSGKLIGAGIAALGLGTGAFAGAAAYEEINESRGISTVDAPESYSVFHDEMDFLGFADELQTSTDDAVVNIGDDMEKILEDEPHIDYGIGIRNDNLYLDWGKNARRYGMTDNRDEIEETITDYI